MDAQTHDPGQVDRRYQEGLAHLQAGEWQSAIACFEDLKHDYPGNLAVERALEEAQLRADLDETTQIKAKRRTIPWRLIVVRTSIILLLAFVVVAGWRIFRQQVAPALARSQAVSYTHLTLPTN